MGGAGGMVLVGETVVEGGEVEVVLVEVGFSGGESGEGSGKGSSDGGGVRGNG